MAARSKEMDEIGEGLREKMEKKKGKGLGPKKGAKKLGYSEWQWRAWGPDNPFYLHPDPIPKLTDRVKLSTRIRTVLVFQESNNNVD